MVGPRSRRGLPVPQLPYATAACLADARLRQTVAPIETYWVVTGLESWRAPRKLGGETNAAVVLNCTTRRLQSIASWCPGANMNGAGSHGIMVVAPLATMETHPKPTLIPSAYSVHPLHSNSKDETPFGASVDRDPTTPCATVPDVDNIGRTHQLAVASGRRSGPSHTLGQIYNLAGKTR